MAKRGLRGEGGRAALAPVTAPFLLTRGDDGGLTLIAPFARRRSGPNAAETSLVRTVAGHLQTFQVWIDPITGNATQSTLGERQLQRRLLDNATFDVQPARPAPG